MRTQAKGTYENNICDQSKTNPKMFWSHIRRNLKTKTSVAPLVGSSDCEAKYSDQDKANILQNQFCSVFTDEPDGDMPCFNKRTDSEIANINITTEIVEKEIKRLNPTKAFGPDEMSPKMLKEIVHHISEPLAIIIRKTLEDGCLPADWKMAHVTPIYKKGAKEIAANYRPVSLTSIICKMTETIIRNEIMVHLDREGIFSSKQYGFINNRSTTTQLLNYLDFCCDAISNKDVVDCIYFDFAKAFDTVPHRRLLWKLESYGIKGKTLDWIKAFLMERQQLVKVNGVESYIGRVTSGIPQGSVLGPLLFVIYINDLPDEVISEIAMFADDTKIFRKVDSINDSFLIQHDIETLEKWSEDWLLKFHPDKCHVLTIGRFSDIKHAHPYKLHGEELEHVFSEKDLGVIIDSELSFEQHISEKVMKANSIMGLIRRSFTYLDSKVFRSLYVSFVRPHLEYAQVVWSPKLRKYVNMIEKVQRRATKLVDGFWNLPYEERLRLLDLPTLEFRRMMSDMVEVFKHLHVYDVSTIPDRFTLRTRPSRKHAFQLLPNFSKDGVWGAQTKSFYFRCINTWNDLPNEVVNSPSVSVFKNRLNEAWEDHPLRYCCK